MIGLHLNIGNRNWIRNFPIPGYHLAFLVVGLGLHIWLGDVFSFTTGWVSTVAGTLCVLLGLVISFWSTISFGQDATAQPTTLHTDGPYRFSRNPMYLGWTLAILGPGFFAGSWLLLGAATLAAVVTHYRVVAGEERFLSERFGDEYETYRRAVRRWLWPLGR